MAHRSNGHVFDQSSLDVSEVRTLPDLATVLRALRRRHARQRRDGELTYRELAARTGWSTAAVAEYLTGRTLPPTDRFDVLVELLGATPVEQGVLATARDRVAEQQRRTPRRPAKAGQRSVPRQLPADVFAFVGRGEQLARLDAMLAGPAPTAVVISAVSGTAGVGKTALAVHWAHRVADRFPDGQLYVNLRGYDPEQPMPPTDALARLLASLRVSGAEIPIDVDERAARYRSQLAGQRMLIVLDNAATVEQVRPLLPGTPSCAVVVTSRDRLVGLVARDGARRVDLDLLPLPDAVALLGHLVGPRAEAEPGAVATLANLCARLPLALRVAAERAATHPAATLAELTAELADRQRRLELMDADGDPRAAVTAVFSWSLQHLPPPVARTFRLLGLHPGADFDEYAAAALAGTDPASARSDLDVLARAHLVHPVATGRYGMHDLLRAYATHLAVTLESDAGRRTALEGLFDAYLGTVRAATKLLDLTDARWRLRVDAPTATGRPLATPEVARAWLDTELPNLAAVATHGGAGGWPAHAIDLSALLYRYLDGGHYADALTIHSQAYRAAESTGDRAGQAYALLGIGVTHLHMCQYERAVDHLRQALTVAEQADDRTQQARVLTVLGNLERLRGRPEPAAGYLDRAMNLARSTGDDAQQGLALSNLGTVDAQQGRYEPAVGHFERAAALLGRSGNRLGEATALTNLGLAEQRLSQYEAAAGHLRQALTVFRQLGHRQGQANTLDNLGSVHLSLGQPDQAVEYFTEALSLCREIDDREVQVWVLNGLGEAAYTTGRHADALAHHTEALAIADEIEAREPQARAHAGLGYAHRDLGDLAGARRHFEHALAGYSELKSLEADNIRTLLAALPASGDG
ncbi:ATP-binding protein [Plantactinospora soyae]|uniref:Tetratricopeptide (TPR) repeat protein/transcriptional regulator with XRE-family HTH domain n=1 Tax=Plantactinospora soyae TaxID=1544732 RepID=A0A927M5N1_9ACTN|nr:tetratricopeptide repeat protein [Plantactinospora soyae]MBE1485903.1 tetratricopeptide (TPR) repeat protein/transcriptional regulator with XRE-family HTH domain [Plantactinospora soyae]